MPNSLESALVIELAGSLQWGAALPPLNQTTGTLTAINPGMPFDPVLYARRDREFQHRDMVAAAAVAKVSIFARTVWNGTVVTPYLQGLMDVTDNTGTNVVMPLDPTQVGQNLPNSSTGIQYVLNASVPYAAVQVTDVNLYNRDLMLYETLARAASIFQPDPPIRSIDPAGRYIGATSVWATDQSVNCPKVVNAAEPMNQATFKDPDLYLADRDNQVASYVAQVTKAIQNPFEFASRIYVQINSPVGKNEEESKTYVLTDNAFILGNVYTAGDQVLYFGIWYQALATTADSPPSSNWTQLPSQTLRQFLADPSLGSRNRIIYDTAAKTLQWFRETLDLVHVPQIVGFLIPGIFNDQTIETLAAIPEKKDAQFYLQKSARIQFSSGTWATQQVFSPTSNHASSSTSVTGGVNALWQNVKSVMLPMPDTFILDIENLFCASGTYALNCLVRPSPEITIAGGDNQQGSLDVSDGGTTFGTLGDSRNWELALPAGGWQLFIDFSNASTTSTSYFGIKASQGATSILANTLPIYYTDAGENPLAQNTVISSPAINIQSTGQAYNFAIQWTAGAGQLHIKQLRFIKTEAADTSHYVMQAQWIGANGTNYAYGTNINSISNLNVIGQANRADLMPFYFYLTGTDPAPKINISWLPNSASAWQAKPYNPGDQVIYSLVYWQAAAITAATDVPGQSVLWTQLGIEPQIPLLFEQIELSKFVQATATPDLTGFQGFRQDMADRALRSTQDAYTTALSQFGTNFPEFRDANNSWTFTSTGSWMSLMEVYDPRLRQIYNISGSNIVPDRQYELIAQAGGHGTYNGQIYTGGQKFYGVASQTVMTSSGTVFLNQIGAYRLSSPADVGKIALVPAGIEYMQNAGTGTVHGWYPSYASYPTHQTIQPWMIEQGFYTAGDDFQSYDGNPSLTPYPPNPTVPHIVVPYPPARTYLYVPYETVNLTSATWIIDVNNILYATDGSYFYSCSDDYTWTELGNVNIGDKINSFAWVNSLFVAVGDSGVIYTSPDTVTWTKQTTPTSYNLYNITYGDGKFIAVGSNGTVITSVNAIDWIVNYVPTTQPLYSILYAAGIFLAVGGGGGVFTSANSSTWTSQNSGVYNNLYQVIYANGHFSAVGAAATVLTSPDGTAWTSHPGSSNSGDLVSIQSILYSGGEYYIAGNLINHGGQSYQPGSQLIFSKTHDFVMWTPIAVDPVVLGNFLQLVYHQGNIAVVLAQLATVLPGISDATSVSAQLLAANISGS